MGDINGLGIDPDVGDDDLGYEWVTCEACGGDGVDGHDCGEDTYCCLRPEENRVCHICRGEGGWKREES